MELIMKITMVVMMMMIDLEDYNHCRNNDDGGDD